jgi:hypothetical protein
MGFTKHGISQGKRRDLRKRDLRIPIMVAVQKVADLGWM